MNAKRNAERLERLKARYGWDQWPGGPTGGELRGVRVGSELLPEWRLEHVDEVRAEGRPPLQHALFTRDRDAALSVEVWECTSTAEARAFLLELLDEFESPLVARATGAAAVGDVAFVHGEYMALFARGNLVVRLGNAGRELVAVEGPAREIAARLARPAGN